MTEYRKLHPGNPFTNNFCDETLAKKQQEICDLIKKENSKYTADAVLQWKFRDAKPFFEGRKLVQDYQRAKLLEERKAAEGSKSKKSKHK